LSGCFDDRDFLVRQAVEGVDECIDPPIGRVWFFALDHFWILVDKRKQAWHDKMSGFFVVKRGSQPIGQCRMVPRVIGFMLLTFTVW
jgi:hypothetical protein